MVKILLVEDNEKNQMLFTFLIESLGYTVIVANNGAEGVDLAKKELPDLILMDIQMPMMDGVTAFGIIKKEENLKNIPVVALTSYAMKGDRENLLEVGFTDYIPKPIRTQPFLEKIKKLVKAKN